MINPLHELPERGSLRIIAVVYTTMGGKAKDERSRKSPHEYQLPLREVSVTS